MPIYVDKSIYKYHRMIMCHMVADTAEELHSMADKIGVNRKWFQRKASFPHYDICKSKRKLAIEKGAIEVTGREIVMHMKRIIESGEKF